MDTEKKVFRKIGARRDPIPQQLLVVRGARFHQDAIRQLLDSPVPQSAYNPSPPTGATEHALWRDFKASLVPIDHEFDADAIQVMVQGKRVGFISRDKNKELKKYLDRSRPDLDCTIFWNGDPDADYQFYTVQLFS